ncbi:MAG: hypothetical protein AAGK04_09810 [Planctomycetota bacterium]
MHDSSATGNDFFKCDFCSSGWTEDRPMVEGHKGSLICASCLSLAYRQVVVVESGEAFGDHDACTLCLMHKEAEPMWRSPVGAEAIVCRECLIRAAVTLGKDREYGWSAPAKD